VIIDSKNRLILGARVSEIPAFGKIAEISRRKYGRRENHHRKNLDKLFKSISSKIDPNAKFKTDEHQFYPILLKKYFPHCSHQRFKSMRASVAGLGELKSKKYDPLFMINHTLAMFRANINRLFRKTWCTSKSEELLQDHVDIFVDYFNQMRLESLK
jgi:IS1 family transposase